MNKEPRFFCDNCGHEVGNDSKTCPYCGRYFASIRCPKCGFHGEDSLFVNGCPSCGYSADSPVTTDKNGKKKHKRKRKKGPRLPAEPLPGYVYIVLTAILSLVVALVSSIITR